MNSKKKKKNFTCATCNMAFIDNAHLKDHEVKHTGVKPFLCTQCNKRFARNGSLRVHMKMHTGDVHEYVCPVEDCCRRFTSRSGFANHQRKHSEELLKKNESEAPTVLKDESLIPLESTPKEGDTSSHVFTCQIPGCFKTFTNQTSLNFHTYRVHLGIDSSLCNKSRCIRLRESYLRQQIQIQKLRDRVKELEAMTSLLTKKERQEFHKEFQKQHSKRDITEGDTTSVVIPVPYLEQEKPYICGIPECGCRFSTYKLLTFHAKQHPDCSLESVMKNQLVIPDGRVHCPVVGCEYGPGHKSLTSYFVLKRHYNRLHSSHKETPVESFGNSVSSTAELLNNLVSEGAVVIQNATIFHDVTIDHSNVSIASSQCQQTIASTHDTGVSSYQGWQSGESPSGSVELPYANDQNWLSFCSVCHKQAKVSIAWVTRK